MAENEKEQQFRSDEEEVVESTDAAVREKGDAQIQASLTETSENEIENGNGSTTIILEDELNQGNDSSSSSPAISEDETSQFNTANTPDSLFPEDKTDRESSSNSEHNIIEVSDLTEQFAESPNDVSNATELVEAVTADYNNDENETMEPVVKNPNMDSGSEGNKRDSWNPRKWATVKTKYLHHSTFGAPERQSQRFNLIGDNNDIPIFSKPADDNEGEVNQKLSSEDTGSNVRKSSKRWAPVQTSYLQSKIPKRKSFVFKLIGGNNDLPIFSKPVDHAAPAVEDAGSDSRGSAQKWAPVSTSYLPRSNTFIETPRSKSAIFNIEAGVLMDIPIHSKRIDDESSETIEATIKNLNSVRAERSGKRLSQRWAPVQTDYIQNLPEREFVAEPKPPIPPDAETIENNDPSSRGCYLKYVSDKYNGALTAVWSPSEVADWLFFLSPGPNAGVKDFMYRQRHQLVFQKDLFFSADSHRPNRMFLSGIMDFFKLGKKFNGTIKFKREKIAELGFKVYFITDGEDVIDLSLDTSAVNTDGITEVEMSNLDAIALIWIRFDDLLGFKKSNVGIFVQRGNLRGNLAKRMSH